ncbi:MAG: HD domain-containing protein, partial [Janthinobacterium sp.]
MSLTPADTTSAALPPLAPRQAAKPLGASAPGAGTSAGGAPAAPALGVASVSHLADKLAEYLSPADLKKVKEAYRFSDEMHLGQMRRSGEPYISHPIAVAEICADWKLDAQAIMAALLHDVMEDQDVKKDELIERFGAPVAHLVDGLSKLEKIEFQSQIEAQAENFRKMLLAMASDVRVILIKLADRLHNMRTLDFMTAAKKRRIASETMEVYVPIAHRLGLNNIYHELQDLSFSHLYPMRYRTLAKAVKAARGNRREVVNKIMEAVKSTLSMAELEADVTGREKTLYDIYKKMRSKHLSFSQVLDVYGFRVVVGSFADCYVTLGTLHSLYKPMPGKFKDYIAIRKLNGYQSLHTTVIGPYGTPVEFQIRTQEMHRTAESGVA